MLSVVDYRIAAHVSHLYQRVAAYEIHVRYPYSSWYLGIRLGTAESPDLGDLCEEIARFLGALRWRARGTNAQFRVQLILRDGHEETIAL